MTRHWGMALAPWDAIGGGHFQTKAQIEERKRNKEGIRSLMSQEQTEQEIKVSEALEKVAKAHGVESITAVALAYVMAKTPNVFPLVRIALVAPHTAEITLNLFLSTGRWTESRTPPAEHQESGNQAIHQGHRRARGGDIFRCRFP